MEIVAGERSCYTLLTFVCLKAAALLSARCLKRSWSPNGSKRFCIAESGRNFTSGGIRAVWKWI